MLVGCGLPSSGVAMPPDRKTQDRNTVFPVYPFCEGSKELGIWAADCLERCIPPQQFKVLCHSGNLGLPHFYSDTGANLSSPLVRAPETSPTRCPEGKPVWRVYEVALEPSNWDELDVIFGESWPVEKVDDCFDEVPIHAARDYFQKHWGPPYVYFYITAEIIPALE